MLTETTHNGDGTETVRVWQVEEAREHLTKRLLENQNQCLLGHALEEIVAESEEKNSSTHYDSPSEARAFFNNLFTHADQCDACRTRLKMYINHKYKIAYTTRCDVCKRVCTNRGWSWFEKDVLRTYFKHRGY